MRDIYRYVMVWVELRFFLVVILLGQYHGSWYPWRRKTWGARASATIVCFAWNVPLSTLYVALGLFGSWWIVTEFSNVSVDISPYSTSVKTERVFAFSQDRIHTKSLFQPLTHIWGPNKILADPHHWSSEHFLALSLRWGTDHPVQSWSLQMPWCQQK